MAFESPVRYVLMLKENCDKVAEFLRGLKHTPEDENKARKCIRENLLFELSMICGMVGMGADGRKFKESPPHNPFYPCPFCGAHVRTHQPDAKEWAAAGSPDAVTEHFKVWRLEDSSGGLHSCPKALAGFEAGRLVVLRKGVM